MRLIDADALWMDIIHRMDYCDDILEIIEWQPTIEPEPKTGEWIEQNPLKSDKCRLIKCSECGKGYIVGFNVPYEDWNQAHRYCVECGSRNGGENDLVRNS